MAESLKPRKRLSRPAPQRASISTARELLSHVQAIGGNLAALVQRAALPYSVESLLDPRWPGQLSRTEFAQLYAQCIWALDAHASWREGREPLTKPELDLLCYCVITCRTLREVIARTTAFSAMLMPRTARLSLRIEGTVAEFCMSSFRTNRSASAFVSDLTGLSMHYRLFGWLIGEDITPIEVAVCYPALLSENTASRLMAHTITYDAPQNLLRFPALYLERPVVRSYAELVRLLDRFPFDLEEAQSKVAPLSERVRLVLGAALAAGSPLPTGNQIARQLSIGSATLRRRLSDEGVSLLRLKDAGRRELAQQLLNNRQHTVAEIASRVGFGDSTTFSRAFKRWTGQSPSRWRQGAIQRLA